MAAFAQRLVCTAVALLGAVPAALSAQMTAEFRISQRASVLQKVSGTTIQVEYSRPGARGRSPLFGGVVHWGEVWTPGANEATVLEVSDTIELEGHTVPAGRWSMWIIPSNVGPWEMLLDPRDTLFHTMRPEVGAESQIRFPIETSTVDHVELLTWSFPEVTRTSATVQMAWGTTAVPLDIRVDAEIPVITVSPEEAARYTGEWVMTFERQPAMPPDAPMPPPMPMTIRYDEEDGHLVTEYPPGAFQPPGSAEPPPGDTLSARERERAEARRQVADTEEEMYSIVLAPRGEGTFLLAFIENENDVLLDIEHVFHEFELENGRAVSLTIRGPNDEVFARGERRQ